MSLKEYLLENEISQTSLADRLGVAVSTVWSMVNSGYIVVDGTIYAPRYGNIED